MKPPTALWASVFFLVMTASPAPGQEWTRFRGPNGSGVSDAQTIPVRWSEADYNWRVKLPGVGHSSPVVWGKTVFVTAGEEKTGTRIVLALDTDSGKTLWSRAFQAGTPRKHRDNSLASSTPAVDAKQLYVCWATPQQIIVRAFDHWGNDVWHRDLGPFQGGHGFGVSPIVYGDLLIVPNDQGGDSSLLALDRSTGEPRWEVTRKGGLSYSTPCVYVREDGTEELIFTNWDHGITAVDPKTGTTNWELDVFDKGHVEMSIASPLVAGGLILGSSGWLGAKNEVIAVRPNDPTRANDIREVYRLDRGAPLVPTPLVVGDFLFLWNDDGVVTCADLETGETIWRRRVPGSYYGSPVAVGDSVYCLSIDGEAVVLAASEEYQLVARNPLGEGSHSTPAIAGGRMFLRTFSHLMSVGRAGK